MRRTEPIITRLSNGKPRMVKLATNQDFTCPFCGKIVTANIEIGFLFRDSYGSRTTVISRQRRTQHVCITPDDGIPLLKDHRNRLFNPWGRRRSQKRAKPLKLPTMMQWNEDHR